MEKERRRSPNRENSFEDRYDQEDGRTSKSIDFSAKREDGGAETVDSLMNKHGISRKQHF